MFTLYVTLSQYHVALSKGGAAAQGWSCRRVGAQPRREIRRGPCNTLTGQSSAVAGRGRVASTIKASKYQTRTARLSGAWLQTTGQHRAPNRPTWAEWANRSPPQLTAASVRVTYGDGTSRLRVVPICSDGSLAGAWWWRWWKWCGGGGGDGGRLPKAVSSSSSDVVPSRLADSLPSVDSGHRRVRACMWCVPRSAVAANIITHRWQM